MLPGFGVPSDRRKYFPRGSPTGRIPGLSFAHSAVTFPRKIVFTGHPVNVCPSINDQPERVLMCPLFTFTSRDRSTRQTSASNPGRSDPFLPQIPEVFAGFSHATCTTRSIDRRPLLTPSESSAGSIISTREKPVRHDQIFGLYIS